MNVKNVLITFLGNIHYDSRTSNFYKTFKDKGFNTSVVSFDWLTDGFQSQKGEISVYKLNKEFSSLLYYLKFSFLLSWKLLFTKADLIFAEDIYTLPFSVIFGKLKGAKVIYDSREVYGHLAGLSKKSYLQNLLRWIEKTFIPGVYKTVTTGELDSRHIEKEYNLDNTIVIRNFPPYSKVEKPFDFRKHYGLPPEIKILLYQGVILHGRGLRIIFDLLNDLDNCVLIIVGGGEYAEYYKISPQKKGLRSKVFFFGKINQDELLKYTAGADIGLSIIENLSLSYYFALPNKMFEYIMAGVPVFASNFPQMKAIIDQYNIGLYTDPENLQSLKESLKLLLTDDALRNKLKENCLTAAKELNWQLEIEKLLPFVQS